MLTKYIAFLFLLAGAAAPAQTTQPSQPISPELKARIQRQLQATYNLPAQLKVEVGPRKPSDIPTFDTVTVTLSATGGGEQKLDFLLSQDGKTLAKITKIDLTRDLFTERMNKIDVKDWPARGNPNAKVTLVSFDDFQCPFCSRLHGTLMKEILPEYADRIKIVYKDFPISVHPWALQSANNANCLAVENDTAYWEFVDFVHANYKEITAAGDLQKSKAELDRIALDFGKKHGAAMTHLQECITSQTDARTKSSVAEGESLGLEATPTIFINGQKLEGAVDADEVRAVLNAQLQAAGIQPPK